LRPPYSARDNALNILNPLFPKNSLSLGLIGLIVYFIAI